MSSNDVLKQKILDEAIRGRLVENDLSLPPIEVEEIKEDIPFEIPSNWKWTLFSNISQIVRGSSPRPIKDYITELTEGINWIKIGDTELNSYYINKTKEKIRLEGMKKSRYVEKGSLLLTNSMSFGKPYILNIDGCIHDGWLNIKDKNNYFNNMFIVYLLSSEYFFNIMTNKSSGAVVSNLNINKVKTLLIPLPPIKEQQRIVSKIEETFALIDKKEKNDKEKEKFKLLLKDKILDDAIHGKLVENDLSLPIYDIDNIRNNYLKEKKLKLDKKVKEIAKNEIPYEIPSNWKWVKLGNLGVYKKGPFGSSLTKDMFVEDSGNSIKVYEQQNAIKKNYKLGNYFITKEKFAKMKSFEVKPNDIIVSCAGTIGETYIIPEDARVGIINQALMKITLFNNEYRDFYLMYFDYVLKKESRDKGKGTALKNIPPFDTLKNMYVPIPPLKQQQFIIAKIGELFSFIDKL